MCFYIQSMLLNGSMTALNGTEDQYSDTLIISNLVLWILIMVLVFVLAYWLIRKNMHVVFGAIAAALILMQSIGFSSLLPTYVQKSNENMDYSYVSTRDDLLLGQDGNVVYFILDTASFDVMTQALTDDPDMLEQFSGFTYYNNMTTTYSRTFPSITYLLTKDFCTFDIPSADWVNQAFDRSTFLPMIKDKGYTIGVYTDASYLGDSILPELVNYGNQEGDADYPSLTVIKNMLQMGLYRHMPYLSKAKFNYEPANINNAILNIPERYNWATYEHDFHQELKEQGVSVDKGIKAFRFYHFYGAHPGCKLMANGEMSSEKTSVVEALRGDFAIIAAFIQELKNAGIYDQTTVIITADHGSSGGNKDSIDLPGNAGSILLYKARNAPRNECIISDAPVCHSDIFGSIYQEIGLENHEYITTISDFSSGDERERLYYYSALLTDLDGEVALREYAVNGIASSLDNYFATGKYWDINYSMNIVSDKNLADLLSVN